MAKWQESILSYQDFGAEFFAESGKGILGDDMGLGKTLTTIAWLSKIKAKKTLFLAPNEITSNLREEIPKWTKDRPIFDLRGYKPTERETLFEMLSDFEEFICIINIEAWSRDHTLISKLIELKFDSLVIDEAHHLNNGSNLSYKGVREIILAINQCPSCHEPIVPKYVCKRSNCKLLGNRDRYRYCLSCGHLTTKIVIPPCRHCKADANHRAKESRSVKNVLGATGTILLNKPADLFWLFHLVAPEDFTSERQFLGNFCKLDKVNKRYIWKEHAKDRLASTIAPYYLARTRKEVGIELPPQGIYAREYDFNKSAYPAQWRAYQRLENQFYLDLKEETVGVTEVVVQILRLRQMLVWPNGIPGVDIPQSFKLDIVERLVREFLDAGQRTIVFSHFRGPLGELQKRLGETSIIYGGSTPPPVKKMIREDFGPKSVGKDFGESKWNVALCNYRSTGEGLNLLGATQIVICDEEWSPGKNGQAYGRNNRLGQIHDTGVHIPRVNSTVDEWMVELNNFKEELVSGLKDAMSLHQRLINAMERSR